VTFWVVLVAGVWACPGVNINNATCHSNCSQCNLGLICTQCCNGYYLDSSSACQPCSDPHCYQCTPASNGTVCTGCYWDYALKMTGSSMYAYCEQCTTSNAWECNSVNPCNSTACYQC
jgi:hypothetical protein